MYDNSHIKLEPKAEDRTESQRLGDEISSAIIQTGACWSTDVIDPIVSKKLQDRFGTGATHTQVWGGEIIGDTVGGFIYVGLKQLAHHASKLPLINKIGDPIEGAIEFVKNKFDKSYDSSGEKALAHWAREHHMDKDDPRYKRKLENYKYYQAESTIDSLIVAGASAASNIVAQKYMFKNTNPWQVITGSKLVGSVATLSLMFGANKTFPNFMQTLDHEMSDRYFSKVANAVNSTLGLETTKPEDTLEDDAPVKKKKAHHFPVLETAATGTLTSMALSKLAEPEEELVHFLPKSLAVGGAMVGGMLAAHWLIPDSIRAFNRELSTRYLPNWRKMVGMGKDTPAENQEVSEDAPEQAANTSAVPLAHDKRERFLASLQRAYMAEGKHDVQEFVSEQKRVCQSFVKALLPDGRFGKAVTEQYKAAVKASGGDLTGAEAYVEDMLLHRRDAMLGRIKLLDDPAFVAELQETLKKGKLHVASSGVSPEKKEKLVGSLMQAKAKPGQDAQARISDAAQEQITKQKALLAALDPASNAGQMLTAALSDQMGSNKQAIASNYLQERQEAARSVIAALAPEGDVVKEAVTRSGLTSKKPIAVPSSYRDKAQSRDTTQQSLSI